MVPRLSDKTRGHETEFELVAWVGGADASLMFEITTGRDGRKESVDNVCERWCCREAVEGGI